MSDNEARLREALARIAEIAGAAVHGGEYSEHSHDTDEGSAIAAGETPSCTVKAVPERLVVKAAQVARQINPVNAPRRAPLAALGMGAPSPRAIAVATTKYWGPTSRQLTVSFIESTPADLRARIVNHLNAWTRSAGISFAETQGTGQVRISRGGGGYWSYLGTDVLLIPKTRPTMNLEGFTMSTPESEYKRVVRHEAGHTLGFEHEHMRKELVSRLDPAKAYAYFLRTQGWSKQDVDEQVLTSLDDQDIMGTPPDQTSIMCYQLPRSITRDGKPIRGGNDINATDYAFAGKIYPKAGHAPMDAAVGEDWGASEDVNEIHV
jgi:hypothetical protein